MLTGKWRAKYAPHLRAEAIVSAFSWSVAVLDMVVIPFCSIARNVSARKERQ
jgi:hypothetical protein